MDMRSLLGAAFAALLLVQPVLASEEAAPADPIKRYRANTEFHLMMCQLAFKMEQMNAQLGKPTEEGEDLPSCIDEAKPNAKENLDAAVAAVASPAAKEALKNYHVAFVVALEGIAPAPAERKISYEVRQASLDGKMDEAWARFEIEQ